ncbi:hypothetical protein L2E82_52282 [Cichorium intybus]|nr:hypothetical protein L2E82_52282 [Cichorium intybus]
MESNLLVLFFLLFFRSSFQQQHQSLPLNSTAERAALLQLRASLGLRATEWPRKSDPCLTWIGLVCQDGRVVGINISGFKRTPLGNQNPKFSVDALANFTKLISFNASGFSLPGSIPNWLGLHLQTLRFLDLRFCEISGAIPSTIGNLSNLSELYLSDNNLRGTIPSTLSLLSQLSVLDLSRNSLTGSIPTHLSNLTSLIILDLGSNSLSGTVPSEFGNLRNLKRLMIRNNNFTGNFPDALWSLPILKFLDASENNFMGSLPNLSLNPNTTIAVFNLSHNMFYGVLTCILKRVSSIDLGSNYLQGEIPDYARDIASLDKNCFRNWSSQRNLKECSDFYSMKGLPFHNFGLPNATFLTPILDHKTNRKKLILAAILGGVGLVLFFVILMIPLILCNKKKKIIQKGIDSCGLNLSGLGEVIAYEKIVMATSEFNDANLIKNGHSGDIFKGILENGIRIIVKRFDVRSRKKRCMVELDFFSKVSHPRLVPLLGHCLEKKEKEMFLVYKYMPKGDLSSSLCRKNGLDDDICLKPLDWITRLKIAIGAAEILSYLHHECVPPLVHRDIQASSILLDDKYEVRLGSLSKACIQKDNNHSNKLIRLPKTSEKGGQGAGATCAYDVYCFGKVLLELVTGKIGISTPNDSTSKNLLENMLPYITIHDKQLVTIIMDPLLIVDEDLLKEVWAVAVVAKSCLNPKPSRRPVMRFVLKALENPLKVVREEQMRLGEVRVDSPRRSWNASWRFGSADLAGGSGSRLRDRCLSVRRHSKDVYPMDVEGEERLNEDWD